MGGWQKGWRYQRRKRVAVFRSLPSLNHIHQRRTAAPRRSTPLRSAPLRAAPRHARGGGGTVHGRRRCSTARYIYRRGGQIRAPEERGGGRRGRGKTGEGAGETGRRADIDSRGICARSTRLGSLNRTYAVFKDVCISPAPCTGPPPRWLHEDSFDGNAAPRNGGSNNGDTTSLGKLKSRARYR